MANNSDFSVTMEGVAELQRKLGILPDRLQGRVLERAVARGSETLVEFMKALAPRGIGPTHAYQFIEAGLDESPSAPTNVEYAVGPTGPGWYLTLHETGTWKMPASPFMVPAMIAGEAEIVRDVADSLRKDLRPGIVI